jgi:hypothetical protein
MHACMHACARAHAHAYTHTCIYIYAEIAHGIWMKKGKMKQLKLRRWDGFPESSADHDTSQAEEESIFRQRNVGGNLFFHKYCFFSLLPPPMSVEQIAIAVRRKLITDSEARKLLTPHYCGSGPDHEYICRNLYRRLDSNYSYVRKKPEENKKPKKNKTGDETSGERQERDMTWYHDPSWKPVSRCWGKPKPVTEKGQIAMNLIFSQMSEIIPNVVFYRPVCKQWKTWITEDARVSVCMDIDSAFDDTTSNLRDATTLRSFKGPLVVTLRQRFPWYRRFGFGSRRIEVLTDALFDVPKLQSLSIDCRVRGFLRDEALKERAIFSAMWKNIGKLENVALEINTPSSSLTVSYPEKIASFHSVAKVRSVALMSLEASKVLLQSLSGFHLTITDVSQLRMLRFEGVKSVMLRFEKVKINAEVASVLGNFDATLDLRGFEIQGGTITCDSLVSILMWLKQFDGLRNLRLNVHEREDDSSPEDVTKIVEELRDVVSTLEHLDMLSVDLGLFFWVHGLDDPCSLICLCLSSLSSCALCARLRSLEVYFGCRCTTPRLVNGEHEKRMLQEIGVLLKNSKRLEAFRIDVMNRIEIDTQAKMDNILCSLELSQITSLHVFVLSGDVSLQRLMSALSRMPKLSSFGLRVALLDSTRKIFLSGLRSVEGQLNGLEIRAGCPLSLIGRGSSMVVRDNLGHFVDEVHKKISPLLRSTGLCEVYDEKRNDGWTKVFASHGSEITYLNRVRLKPYERVYKKGCFNRV